VVPGAGDSQAWDRYAFVYNNPLRYSDPSGHGPNTDPLIDGLYGVEYATNYNNEIGTCPTAQNPDKESWIPYIVSRAFLEVWRYGSKFSQKGERIVDISPISSELADTFALGTDVAAWLINLYATAIVTAAFFTGAGVGLPFSLGGPEVPVVTGITGVSIAELYVQPLLRIADGLGIISTSATIYSDLINGSTIIESILIILDG